MYAPYAGNMPGGQNPSFWHYQNSTIDRLAQHIAFFNFTSANERNDLVRNATLKGIHESVRIFVAQLIEPYVAVSSLKGLINDFGAGITSKYSLSNARTPKVTNSLDIGVKQIYQGAWNNIAGCKDAYCSEIFTQLADSATFRNPYTGDVIPMREVWTNITTLGPHDKIHVPDDVHIWNPVFQKWTGLGTNDSAMSRVTFRPLLSKWQNGIMMDKADIFTLFTLPLNGELILGTRIRHTILNIALLPQVALPLIKGIKFDSNNTFESYIDQWHYDKKEIADSAAIWPSEPWEITAATERLVMSGKFAPRRSRRHARRPPRLRADRGPDRRCHAAEDRRRRRGRRSGRAMPCPRRQRRHSHATWRRDRRRRARPGRCPGPAAPRRPRHRRLAPCRRCGQAPRHRRWRGARRRQAGSRRRPRRVGRPAALPRRSARSAPGTGRGTGRKCAKSHRRAAVPWRRAAGPRCRSRGRSRVPDRPAAHRREALGDLLAAGPERGAAQRSMTSARGISPWVWR